MPPDLDGFQRRVAFIDSGRVCRAVPVEDGDVAGREGGGGGGREQGGPEDERHRVRRVEPRHADVPSLDVGRGGGPGVWVPGGGGGGGGKHHEEEGEEEEGGEEDGVGLHGLVTRACDLM